MADTAVFTSCIMCGKSGTAVCEGECTDAFIVWLGFWLSTRPPCVRCSGRGKEMSARTEKPDHERIAQGYLDITVTLADCPRCHGTGRALR